MRPVQFFTPEYLEDCKRMGKEHIIAFLEDFRTRASAAQIQTKSPSKSKLISLKVPEDLLEAFKAKAARNNCRYQSKIKELMSDWLYHPDTK